MQVSTQYSELRTKSADCDTLRSRRVLPQATIFLSRRDAFSADRFCVIGDAVHYYSKKEPGIEIKLNPQLLYNHITNYLFRLITFFVFSLYISVASSSFDKSMISSELISCTFLLLRFNV